MSQLNRKDFEISNYTIFQAALDILYDKCPPERHMYQCMKSEVEEPCCEECWQRYLFYLANGRKGDPDYWDKVKEDI